MPAFDRTQAAPCLSTAEGVRLRDAEAGGWRRWGPYLSERAWGTVREDYSPDGDAWTFFPHDHARSRAYRWSEDGIAGFSDDQQRWCLALALWNGRDPILKERMFGLTNAEGNHGEDVKELWYYVDGLPTHAYMKTVYKYPQAPFPYGDLVAENARRKRTDATAFEYELFDTGVFGENRYFDVITDYAKHSPDDILMRVTIANRGPEAADLHVLPHLWARNVWSWEENHAKPSLALQADGTVLARRLHDRDRRFSAIGSVAWLFCENETNRRRLYGEDVAGYFKDGINDRVVAGDHGAVNPDDRGTKCAAWLQLRVDPGAEVVLRFRFAPAEAATLDEAGYDAVFRRRIDEADSFYAAVQADIAEPDARLVQRQAFAGMLWSKQYYHMDVRRWLAGDPAMPKPPASRRSGRDSDWTHLVNADIISMPDKWEYPWYAAWDLAFHCTVFALIDPEFAKAQLILLTREWYMHPNGQLPAYEWNFGDVNPPVHGLAAYRVYQMDRAMTGTADRAFLVRIFHKLMINFTWWVNRKDPEGRNIFQGGFLGLDNIGVFDRSKPLPTGGFIAQADGTAWMASYCLNLLQIALELAEQDGAYEDIATKFFEHFLLIAEAMTTIGEEGHEKDELQGLWDEWEGFYYDILNLPDGSRVPLKVRSLVGLIPLCAVAVLDGTITKKFPDFAERLRWTLEHRPDQAQLVSRWGEPGKDNRLLLSLLRRHRMQALLLRVMDDDEFLSPYGIRSVSKFHKDHPFTYDWDGTRFQVDYEPAESTTTLFGGNSNWRGPIWMPINVVLIEALYEFEKFYHEEDFTIEYPKGSGTMLTLPEIGAELTRRLNRIFLRDENGRRAVLGGNETFQTDPHFRDLIPFHEYFHGDDGAGLGAAHQTGWSGLAAFLLQPRKRSAGTLIPVTSDHSEPR